MGTVQIMPKFKNKEKNTKYYSIPIILRLWSNKNSYILWKEYNFI